MGMCHFNICRSLSDPGEESQEWAATTKQSADFFVKYVKTEEIRNPPHNIPVRNGCKWNTDSVATAESAGSREHAIKLSFWMLLKLFLNCLNLVSEMSFEDNEKKKADKYAPL